MYTDLVEALNNPNNPKHKFIKQHIDDLRLSLYSRGFLIDLKNKNLHKESENIKLAPECINFIPIPIPFPRSTFQLSKTASIAIIQLIDMLSNDNEFIISHFNQVTDPFISKLLIIYKKIFASKSANFPKVRFYFNRSDFMIQGADNSENGNKWCERCGSNTCICSSTLWPKLIETNCIAISLGTHSTTLNNSLAPYFNVRSDPSAVISKFFNYAIETLDKISNLTSSTKNCVLIIYREIGSIFDWGPIGSKLEDDYNIKVFYYTLEQLIKMRSKNLLRFFENNIILIKFNGEYTVKLIHFRTCYNPQHIETEKQWEIFEMLHMSDAIKLPDISTYLVCSKYAQMVWSKPDFISKLPPHLIEPILNTRIHQSDPALDIEMANAAMLNPHQYVLKNHLEGGYGVFFENDLAEKSKLIKNPNEYVLSKRIFPPVQKAIFVSNYGPNIECSVEECVTELGIFSLGVFTGHPNGGDADLIDVDTFVGRTKRAKQCGGSINTGISYLSTFSII